MLKEITPFYPVFPVGTGSMTGTSTITSLYTNISYKDNFVYELSWTGNPTGNFFVQASVTYNPGTPQSGGQFNAGNWITLPALDQTGAAPVASGAPGILQIALQQLQQPWIRVIYTNVSGTGTLSGWVFGKSIG